MFDEKRASLYASYVRARDYFTQYPQALIDLEAYITQLVNFEIAANYQELERDYNEASYLHALWANYPPENRGRAPVGDQIPWNEVGEHSIGHKLNRLIAAKYTVVETGLPSGADNRFVLYSDQISAITNGLTNCAFVFLDIKSVGPRDYFAHTVLSPYQVSGDGLWAAPDENMENSPMLACGKRTSHPFYPAISPIYPLINGAVAPAIHLFVKPFYRMLNLSPHPQHGQPLVSIQNICVPNGLLLTCNPNYLDQYPGLFYPGKDEAHKPPRKRRVRVSFPLLEEIAPWRVSAFHG